MEDMELRQLAKDLNREILIRWEPKDTTFILGKRKRKDAIVGVMHLFDHYGFEMVNRWIERFFKKGDDRLVVQLGRGDKITLISK